MDGHMYCDISTYWWQCDDVMIVSYYQCYGICLQLRLHIFALLFDEVDLIEAPDRLSDSFSCFIRCVLCWCWVDVIIEHADCQGRSPFSLHCTRLPFHLASFSLSRLSALSPMPAHPSFSCFVLRCHQLCVWQQTPQAPAQLSAARGVWVFPPPLMPPAPLTLWSAAKPPSAHTPQTLGLLAAMHCLAIEMLQWSWVAECTLDSKLWVLWTRNTTCYLKS